MAKNTRSGFTLIELLVVIGIISLLAVVLLPNIIGGKEKANILADQGNLRWHYAELNTLREQKKLPLRGGCRFVLATWYRGIVEKTEANMNRYFNPALASDDVKIKELLETGVAKIWPREEAITSADTHYAGRSEKHYIGMMSGNEAWLADDCEGVMPFPSGSINVLYGDGVVKPLLADPDLLKYGWKLEDAKEGKLFDVGPSSPHPDLKKLEK